MADINNTLGFTGTIVNPLQDLQSVLTVGNFSDLNINLVPDYLNPGSDGGFFAPNGAAIVSGDYQGVLTATNLALYSGALETSLNAQTGLLLSNGGTDFVNIKNTITSKSYNLLTPDLEDSGDYYIPTSVNGIFADISGNIVLPDPIPYIPTLQEVCEEGNTYEDIPSDLITVIQPGQVNVRRPSTSIQTNLNPELISFAQNSSSVRLQANLSTPFSTVTQTLQHQNGIIALLSDIPSLTSYQLTSEKNNANGYAGLDGSGKIFSSQLPSITVTEVYTVASQVAQLALVADEGDVAIRTDLSKSYIHNGGVTGTMADWSELLTPTGGVTSVTGTTNRITSTGGTSPVIDISAAYVGQTSITTLGTIATGIWQGTAIADTYISSASVWNAKVGPTRTLTINGSAQDLSANRTWTVGDVIMSPATVQTATTQTGSSAIGILNLEQTWNTSGTPTMLKMNVVDTASNAASLLFDFQMGGVSRVKSSKVGVVTSNGFNSSAGGIRGSYYDTSGNVFNFGNTSLYGATGVATVTTSGDKRAFYANYSWSPTSGTSTMTAFNYNGTINQTGGANGITRAFYANPTLTAAADFRAFEASTGAIVLPYRAVTTTSSLLNSDYLIVASNTITITLPSSVAGKIIKIKNIDTGTITINPLSGTIDGVSSKSLTVQYTGFEFTGDGTNWLITGTF